MNKNNNLFTFTCNIHFFDEHRKSPIDFNPYRPIFFFENGINRSGWIVVDEGQIYEMGKSYEQCTVKIYFYDDLNLSTAFFPGLHFNIGEGSKIIGEGKISNILGII